MKWHCGRLSNIQYSWFQTEKKNQYHALCGLLCIAISINERDAESSFFLGIFQAGFSLKIAAFFRCLVRRVEHIAWRE